MRDQADSWIILRCTGQRTLKLAASLVEAGIEAWTPTLSVKRRIPRRQTSEKLRVAMLPTFVFARASHLHDLVRLLRLPGKQHPAFSILQHDHHAAVVRDRQLTAVRMAEQKAAERDRVAALKASAPAYAEGDKVTVDQLAFTGMVGEVTGIKGKAAVVNFGGGMAVTIDAWLLLPHAVSAAPVQPMDTAA